MRVLVTGASGFLGRNLITAAPRDWQMTATYWSAHDFPAFVSNNDLAHIRPLRVNLTDRTGGALAELADGYDSCVFLAANGDPAHSVTQPGDDLLLNAGSVVSLLERVRVGHLVFLSSGAVYDGLSGAVSPAVAVHPRLPYAISKAAAERYVAHFVDQRRVASATIIRFFGAYGPHEPPRKIYNRLVHQFAFDRDPRFVIRGDGRNLIDAMYVSDATDAILRLVARTSARDTVTTLDLSSGTPLTLTELVERAGACFSIRPSIGYEGTVPEYIAFRSVDRTVRELTGFMPSVSLEAGLRRLAEHLSRGAAE